MPEHRVAIGAHSRARASSRPFDLLRTPPRVVLANFYPFALGECVARQASESNLFVLTSSGSGRIQVGSEWFALHTGSVLHVPWDASVLYQADVHDPFVVVCVHLVYRSWAAPSVGFPTHRFAVENERRPRPVQPQPFDEAFLITPPPDTQLFELATNIVRAYEQRPEQMLPRLRDAVLRGLALEFLAGFLDLAVGGRHAIGAGSADAVEARIVREIAAYLEFTLAKPHTRKALARRAGVSESGLSRAFRAVLGKGPIDYLIDLRLAKAKQRIATSRARIGELAAEVGIADVYHFSKLFKKRMGMSPREYRRRHRL